MAWIVILYLKCNKIFSWKWCFALMCQRSFFIDSIKYSFSKINKATNININRIEKSKSNLKIMLLRFKFIVLFNLFREKNINFWSRWNFNSLQLINSSPTWFYYKYGHFWIIEFISKFSWIYSLGSKFVLMLCKLLKNYHNFLKLLYLQLAIQYMEMPF